MAERDGVQGIDEAMRTMFEGELFEAQKQLSTARTTDDVLSLPLSAAGRVEPTANHLSERFGVACRSGCSWCCRGLKVDVTAPEAVLIADYLTMDRGDQLSGEVQRLSLAAADARALTSEARWRAQVPCYFLDQTTGECQVYDVRPLACRAHSSLDASSCERASLDPDGQATVTKFVVTAQMYGISGAALAQTYEAAGLDARGFELTNAVLVALNEPDAGARWRQGERLFDAAVLPSDEADRALAQRDMVRAGLLPAGSLVRKPQRSAIGMRRSVRAAIETGRGAGSAQTGQRRRPIQRRDLARSHHTGQKAPA